MSKTEAVVSILGDFGQGIFWAFLEFAIVFVLNTIFYVKISKKI
jgi:hypothetical protein